MYPSGMEKKKPIQIDKIQIYLSYTDLYLDMSFLSKHSSFSQLNISGG